MESGDIKGVGPSSASALAGEEKKQELAMKEEEEHQEDEIFGKFVPGPLLPLKEHIEKDKEDESLRRWKEKLLGCLESDLNDQMEPEVKFHSIGIISSDGEVNTPFPLSEDLNKLAPFTLREGSSYQLKLTFSVLHNIVSGLVYTNTVWKGGLEVDRSSGMLGTFAPRKEPYAHTLEEETTPSGVLARGVYTAKLKFKDDDKRCHMELNYSFEIRKCD
ncbi:rho GDP-dissociation inhibitor 1-like isoform X1 [Primulina tabacum]|uniref:rho GDP-dissociation inhibitor 1-like isoform X1 n=1 Tax=Primulina tabacum TaxID=48773 RepID=UPI003F59B619